MKLKQTKCPNCGAKLDTRRFIPNGYEVEANGTRHLLYLEQKIIKCQFCRSEFELCGEGEE